MAPVGTATSTSAATRRRITSRTAPPTTTASRPAPASLAARSSAAWAGTRRSSRSSATVQQPRGIVVEDLATHAVGQRAIPGPAALLVVVVRDQRQIRAEQNPVLPAHQRRRGDRRRVAPDVTAASRRQ